MREGWKEEREGEVKKKGGRVGEVNKKGERKGEGNFMRKDGKKVKFITINYMIFYWNKIFK